jgi:hypothetical protein
VARQRGLMTKRFEDVHRVLEKERAGQSDLYCPLSRMHLRGGSSLAPVHDRYQVDLDCDGRARSMALAPTALNHLCGFAGIPYSFLERVPSALGLKLLRCLLEMASGDEDRAFLFRLKEARTPRIRAILPASFVRISDRELLEDVEHSLDRPAVIMNLAITADLFSLRVVFPGEGMELGYGDPAMPGLDLQSSETGLHPLQVRRVLFRQVCANGMTSLTDSQKLLQKRMTRFDRDEFRAAVRQGAAEAVGYGSEMAERLRTARTEFLKDPASEIERLFTNYKLGSPRGDRAQWVANALVRDLPLFGVGRFEVVQAFTAVARGLEHEHRVKWEDAMSDYVANGGSAG